MTKDYNYSTKEAKSNASEPCVTREEVKTIVDDAQDVIMQELARIDQKLSTELKTSFQVLSSQLSTNQQSTAGLILQVSNETYSVRNKLYDLIASQQASFKEVLSKLKVDDQAPY
jgi:hypothetical protein